jgi:hypothetical protein
MPLDINEIKTYATTIASLSSTITQAITDSEAVSEDIVTYLTNAYSELEAEVQAYNADPSILTEEKATALKEIEAKLGTMTDAMTLLQALSDVSRQATLPGGLSLYEATMSLDTLAQEMDRFSELLTTLYQ